HTRSKRDWSSDVCSSDLVFSGNNRDDHGGRYEHSADGSRDDCPSGVDPANEHGLSLRVVGLDPGAWSVAWRSRLKPWVIVMLCCPAGMKPRLCPAFWPVFPMVCVRSSSTTDRSTGRLPLRNGWVQWWCPNRSPVTEPRSMPVCLLRRRNTWPFRMPTVR